MAFTRLRYGSQEFPDEIAFSAGFHMSRRVVGHGALRRNDKVVRVA